MKLPRRKAASPDTGAPVSGEQPSGSSTRTHRQRVFLLVFALLATVVVVAFLWIAVTGLMARSRLQAADRDIPRLKSAISAGNLTAARAVAAHIADQAASARRLTAGPAWWTVANLPLIGSPLRTARVLTGQTQRVSAEAPTVLDAANRLVRAHRAGQDIDSAAVNRVTAAVGTATSTTRRATDDVASSSASWFPAVGHARSRLLGNLRTVNKQLAGVDKAVSVLGPMLGPDEPRTYFVGFMNEAESRGLGGLPGAFAILTVDRGRFHFTHFGNDPEFHDVHTGLDLGTEYNARYGQDEPASEYVNSDVSPDLRDAARIWAAMWQKKSGQHVDGALVLDPTTLSYLLKVSGPAVLSDGTRVTSENVVADTQSTVYSKFSSDARRNAYLSGIAAAAAKTLVNNGGKNPLKLFTALATAADQRRFAVWSADASLENKIIGAGFGAVLQPSSAYTGFTVVNAGGNKLDYYLQRRMTYTRSSCAAGATAVATFQMTNGAPRSGLPLYVTQRVDDHPADVKPGDNRLLVTYYASSGASIVSTTVNGKVVAASIAPEKGLVAVMVDVELPVGATRTVVVTIREPAPQAPLQVLKQPLVRPEVTAVDQHCGAAG